MRAGRGRTYDPCHCCGNSTLRPKDRICDECQRTFNFAKDREKELATLTDQAPLPYYVKERYYALPYLRRGGDPGRDVQEAFHDLSVLVSSVTQDSPPLIPATKREPCASRDPKFALWEFEASEHRQHEWECVRAFSPPIAAAIRVAYSAVRAAVEYAYKDGHDDGRRLLMQLAAGEITADNFNEAAARFES